MQLPIRISNRLTILVSATAIVALSPPTLDADDSDMDEPNIDACRLLLPAEISTAIGFRVSDGQRADDGPQPDGSYSSTCVWTIVDDVAPIDRTSPLGGRSFVILNAMQWPAGSGLASTFLDAFRRAAEAGEIPSMPSARELGDEALWWGDGLAVRRRDTSFGLSVFISRSATQPAPYAGAFEERLAPLILKRLDQEPRHVDVQR